MLAVCALCAADAPARSAGEAKGIDSLLDEASDLLRRLPAAAVARAEQARREAQLLGDRSAEAAALRLQAIGHWLQTDYPTSLERALESERLFRETGDPGGRAAVLTLIGAIYGNTERQRQALEVLDEALALAREAGDADREGRILINMASAWDDLGDYPRALAVHEEALALLERTSGPRAEVVMFTRLNIGEMHFRTGDTARGIRIVEEVLAEHGDDGDVLVRATALKYLGDFHLRMAAFEAAGEALQQAVDLAREAGLRQVQLDALDLLARAAEGRGDYPTALAHQRASNALSLEIFNEGTSSRLADLEAWYEAEMRDQQIALQEARLAQSQQLTFTLGAGAVLMGLLAILAFQRYGVKHRSNLVLQDLASADPLTGLMNRRAIALAMEGAEQRAAANAETATVIMVDIDGFKQVNDSHGHQVGDEVLRTVAAAIKASTRRDDAVSRWGGEEFLVITAGHDASQPLLQAERICAAVRNRQIGLADGSTLALTVSAGVAVLDARTDAEAAVRNADAALYEAKRSGGDRAHFRGV